MKTYERHLIYIKHLIMVGTAIIIIIINRRLYGESALDIYNEI